MNWKKFKRQKGWKDFSSWLFLGEVVFDDIKYKTVEMGLVDADSFDLYKHLSFVLPVFSSLKMKPDVVLRHLSIAVAATDQSYMPQQVTVAVGRSASDLQDVRDVHIPSNVTGYVTLLENANISQLCESTTRQPAC